MVLDTPIVLAVFFAEDSSQWAADKALLISGPSMTADIELILTFGVHGPKELLVFILDG